MKVALVHDWLTGMRGGERVLEELCRIFTDASIFTLFHEPGSVSTRIESMPIHTSFLNRIPTLRRNYRHALPLLPWAISTLDLGGFDLVLSVSHAAAKAIRKPTEASHICYCLTPMRYIWDMQGDYFQYADPLRIKRTTLQAMLYPLRLWDRSTADSVDHFIAQCRHVQSRISRYYQRESDIIYPPVDTDFFTPAVNGNGEDFYLIVSALVPYKRVDIAIEAFNRLGHPLVIVGTGPDLERLQNRAASNIQFRGFVSNQELLGLYRHCRAVIISAREDFGLVSLEAQACGRPAVAFGAGGSLESITDGETGILFKPQTVAGLIKGIEQFEATRFNAEVLRKNAERFSKHAFRRAILKSVDKERATRHSSRWAADGPMPCSVPPETGATDRQHPSLKGLPGIAKRGIDIALSFIGLLILGLPLFLLALFIRYRSEGPGLFFQRRTGLGGRTFIMIKLRTMRKDAERLSGPAWPVSNDPRCTPGGTFLRKYGLDELPQLWNVLKGDMSFIGPRPERPEFQAVFEQRFPEFRRRLEVRGGISGLAQIHGWRGDTSLEQRLKTDLEYIDNWSFWRDVLILCRTPLFLIRQKEQRSTVQPIPDAVGVPRLDEGPST